MSPLRPRKPGCPMFPDSLSHPSQEAPACGLLLLPFPPVDGPQGHCTCSSFIFLFCFMGPHLATLGLLLAGSGDPMGCKGSNLGWPRAKQTSSPYAITPAPCSSKLSSLIPWICFHFGGHTKCAQGLLMSLLRAHS